MNRYKYAQAMHAVGKSPANVTRLQTVVLSFSFDDIPARHSIIPIGIYSAQGLSDRCTEEEDISQTRIQPKFVSGKVRAMEPRTTELIKKKHQSNPGRRVGKLPLTLTFYHEFSSTQTRNWRSFKLIIILDFGYIHLKKGHPSGKLDWIVVQRTLSVFDTCVLFGCSCHLLLVFLAVHLEESSRSLGPIVSTNLYFTSSIKK